MRWWVWGSTRRATRRAQLSAADLRDADLVGRDEPRARAVRAAAPPEIAARTGPSSASSAASPRPRGRCTSSVAALGLAAVELEDWEDVEDPAGGDVDVYHECKAAGDRRAAGVAAPLPARSPRYQARNERLVERPPERPHPRRRTGRARHRRAPRTGCRRADDAHETGDHEARHHKAHKHEAPTTKPGAPTTTAKGGAETVRGVTATTITVGGLGSSALYADAAVGAKARFDRQLRQAG